jgi:hypothetical protein
VLEKLVCPKCGREEKLFASLGRVSADMANCPGCRESRREVRTFHKIVGTEDFLGLPLAQIGVPAFDIVIARNGAEAVGFELGGDASGVLGPLADSEGLQWA